VKLRLISSLAMLQTPGEKGSVGRHHCKYSVVKPKEMEASPLSKYVLIQFNADNSLGVFLSEYLIVSFEAKLQV
jgi:hypothetical protein